MSQIYLNLLNINQILLLDKNHLISGNEKRPLEVSSLFPYVLLSELFLLVSGVFNSRFFTSKVSEVVDS
jgi:hypothetical protein